MNSLISFRMVIFLALSFNFVINDVNSAKILFVFPLATKSHFNVFKPLILKLAETHHLTLISPLKLEKPLSNVREINPVPFDEINPLFTQGDPFEKRKEGKLAFFLNWNATFIQNACDKVYRNGEIKEMMKNEAGTFDVTIVNGFMNGCTLGMVHTIGAPFIYIVTMPAMNMQTFRQTGLLLPPSFVPSSFSGFSDSMTFIERTINWLSEYTMLLMAYVSWDNYVASNYRRHLEEHMPGMIEIERNVSLILMNSHFSVTYSRPLLPDVVEVAGMFTRPAKPLPKDLDEFLSSSGKDGFIYFSFGSIVQAKDMPLEMRTKFLNVFSKLKQKVIWKWEGDVPDNLPANVKLYKWLPQQDILGHKNIRLFITHGGLLSTQEAVYHGVPLIGFPIFADQDMNMQQAEKSGFARKLEVNEFTEEELADAINHILNEPKMSSRAKELSLIFKDRPSQPVDTAAYWVDYIIRHKGAHHLRSAARDLNLIQYHSIDVVAFLIAIVLVILWLIKKVISLIFKCLFRRGQSQTKLKRN